MNFVLMMIIKFFCSDESPPAKNPAEAVTSQGPVTVDTHL